MVVLSVEISEEILLGGRGKVKNFPVLPFGCEVAHEELKEASRLHENDIRRIAVVLIRR